ncbi:type III pantothenate kinase [Balneolaceae bacterium ANBcel3]|nr:type III pantothenate kinase [Balneolaceae bacterium ANBcel3]
MRKKGRVFIDVGNSRIKAASMEHGQWKQEGVFELDDPLHASRLCEITGRFEKAVVASVKKEESGLRSAIGADHIIELKSSDIPAEAIRYQHPERVGIDRFLACLGAWDKARSAVVVTDAGTACTIDVMDTSGVFLGGVIMPGRRLLARSLGEGTDALFEVEPGLPAQWPPDSTKEALKAGTTGTFLAAWEAHIQKMLEILPDAELWVTGGEKQILGDASERTLKIDENLVFQGMLFWIEHWG